MKATAIGNDMAAFQMSTKSTEVRNYSGERRMVSRMVLLLVVGLWTVACGPDTTDYQERGTTVTDLTQQKLQAELQAAMKAGGPANAVAFCASRAQVLMDSMSQAHGVQIRRATMRPRNAVDRATAREELALEFYAQRQLASDSLLPTVEVDNGVVHYFRPIVLGRPCLACHGTPNKHIAPETAAVIAAAYPNDQATGYAEGDLRGVWHVMFTP